MIGNRPVSILLLMLAAALIAGGTTIAQDTPSLLIARPNKTRPNAGDLPKWSPAPLLVKVAAVSALTPTTTEKNGRTNRKYTVWVFKLADGKYEKQADRTLKTDDEGKARSYLESVKAVSGWTATSNLPAEKQDEHPSSTKTANSVEGAVWTYVGSIDGCLFRFESGNRLWASSYAESGTWKQEGTKVSMEIPYGRGAGLNVFTGVVGNREIHAVVTSSPNPHNVGVEFILERLPLAGFSDDGTQDTAITLAPLRGSRVDVCR
ncbi:MAG TPA: hypothetical protein VMR25_11005 [Planctomycetaceae bacterium]|jgi:hypothetical protein|nr:hypothetical protein [Planctomycetaceae bacterium]